MAINLKYYNDKDFRAKAVAWWRTLSINQQKDFQRKYVTPSYIGMRVAVKSEIAEIYDGEVKQNQFAELDAQNSMSALAQIAPNEVQSYDVAEAFRAEFEREQN